MYRKIVHTSFFFFVMLLYSCQYYYSLDDKSYKDERQELHFKVGFPAQTRITTDAQFKSSFTVNDEIGLYIVERKKGETKELEANGNYADNIKLTYNGNDWVSEDIIYHPGRRYAIDIYAYYPYDENLTDPTRMDLAVKVDQGSEANYNASDFLFAKTEMIEKQDDAIISFKHALSAVQIDVQSGGVGAVMDNDVSTYVHAYTNYEFNLSQPDSLKTKGTSNKITMLRVMPQAGDSKYIFRAIVPSQKIDEGKELFSFTNRETLSHKVSEDITLSQGTAKKNTVKLDAKIEKGHNYAIGDAYPYRGFPMGVVFYANPDNQGATGYVVGLKEETTLAWSTQSKPETVNGINDVYYGQTPTLAMIAAYKDSPTFQADYPIFHWISQLQAEGPPIYWFVPSRNQLGVLRDNKAIVNAKLNDLNGLAISNERYWTSTQSSSLYARYINMATTGLDDNTTKSSSLKARAVFIYQQPK